MIGVDQQNDIGLADFLVEALAVLGQGRGIDDDGGDILGRTQAGRQGDLGEGGLDLGSDKDILDQGGDEARFPSAFVPAYADANYGGEGISASTTYGVPAAAPALRIDVWVFGSSARVSSPVVMVASA